MPADTKHPEFAYNFPEWIKCRDFVAGARAVKSKGTIYLPKLQDQTAEEYSAYVQRAFFFNASGRTIESFVGMIFRKDPENKMPESLQPIIADITLTGESLYDYEKFITNEVICVGRSGSMIDWNDDEGRPFVQNYQAEQILNWRISRQNGKSIVSLITLFEKILESEAAQAVTPAGAADQPLELFRLRPVGVINQTAYTGPVTASRTTVANDEFNPKVIEQIRVLRINADGFYEVEVFQKQTASSQPGKTGGKKTDGFQSVGKFIPMRKGSPLTEIPFVFHGPNNLLPEVDKSPMSDIVDANLHHYLTSADMEHGCHYLGLPTPYVTGCNDKIEMRIGAATMMKFSKPEAKVGYLEFKGEGLKTLESRLEAKEHYMAVLGARMLDVEKRAAETTDVMQMKQTGELASLSQIAATISRSFEIILAWCLWWQSAADTKREDLAKEITVEFNSEFNPTDINPQLAGAIGTLFMQNLLSKDSAVWALQKGELVRPTRTVDEEIELISTEMKLQGEPLPLNDKSQNPAPKK